MNIKHYGKSSEEENISELIIAREICQEILQYGVTQRQVLKIIYNLSLELENSSALVEISNVAKKHLELNEKPHKKPGVITDLK